jgi:hypothetical protein
LNQKLNFSISVVSHGHRKLVLALLDDIAKLCRDDLEVILTWNLTTENTELHSQSYPFRLQTILNTSPKGFARNHNAAFQHASGKIFVLLNPDIRLAEDPFDALLRILNETPNTICAPTILNTKNEVEDSARYFPSPWTLFKKAVIKAYGGKHASPPVPRRGTLLYPDWIAGMFIAVPNQIYSALGGLSEDYFLYYEDVDLCARAQLQGIKILVTTKATAIHDARRQSHRNLRFFWWHLCSATKFFSTRTYWKTMLRKKENG